MGNFQRAQQTPGFGTNSVVVDGLPTRFRFPRRKKCVLLLQGPRKWVCRSSLAEEALKVRPWGTLVGGHPGHLHGG